MKKQNNILWVLMVLMIVVGNMKGNAQQKSLRDIFDHVIYTGEPIASSELVERGLPGDFYSAKKAVDGKVETAWVEGVEGDGVNEYIYFKLELGAIPHYNEFNDKHKYIEFEISIVNGIGKSKKLYEMNNRIKKAILEVYEARVAVRQIEPCIISEQEPVLNSILEINFKDDIRPQKFRIKIRPKQMYDKIMSNRFMCIGKLIIKEVYSGSKYKDTGISEIDVNRIDEE
ncbi:MAG: hypothetical protein WHV26_02940 [Spirochaetota bacterium]